HGSCVTKNVRSHTLAAERRATPAGDSCVLGDKIFDGVSDECSASPAWKGGRIWIADALIEQRAKDLDRVSGQRRTAVLPTLSATTHVGTSGQDHVGSSKTDELRDPEPGLHADEQDRVVTSTQPRSAIRCSEQRLDFDASERGDEATRCALGRDRENALARGAGRGLFESDEPEERVDCCKSSIAGAGRIPPFHLELVEKRVDEGCVDVGEQEVGRRLVQTLASESEQ